MGQGEEHKHRRLRLIHGDLDRTVHCGPVTMMLAPEDRPPFAVGAVAVEQDTALVLDEEPVLNVPHSSLKQLGDEMERFSEPVPGSVVVQRGTPRRLYAIVHDLEQEPTWREEWVAAALENLMRLADRQHLQAVALPLLGSRFGKLSAERFVALLTQAIREFPPHEPLRLWLVVPREEVHRLLKLLERSV